MKSRMQVAVEILRRSFPDVEAVYHFGSTANDYERNESDVDLAVLARQPLSALTKFDVACDLAAVFDRQVDIVDLFGASPVLLHQVIETGQLVYVRDPSCVAEFETTSLAKYCFLNEERREILEDIHRRGSIYGR